jgi:hypothetical protein
VNLDDEPRLDDQEPEPELSPDPLNRIADALERVADALLEALKADRVSR